MRPDISLFDEKDTCGYPVSTLQKQQWLVELKLADQFIRICEKYDLKYIAAGGTLLGAVRHSGFIPWDDDMDFFLPYNDYRKFCEIAPLEIALPYAFQQKLTLSRIRDSNTTGCTTYELEHATDKDNLGIFIDIFPLTKIPDSILERKIHKVLVRILRIANRGKDRKEYLQYKHEDHISMWFEPKILLYEFVSIFCKDLNSTYIELCGAYENRNTKELAVTSFLTYNNKYIWNTEWFCERITHTFENRVLKIPKQYDAILRKCFGDYNKFDMKASQHTLSIVDPETPYKEYVKKRSMI